MTIVFTGATGYLGHLIVEALLHDGVAPSDIVAGGRNLAKLDDPAAQGVRVAAIDYNEPHTLTDALAGAARDDVAPRPRPGAQGHRGAHRTFDHSARRGVGSGARVIVKRLPDSEPSKSCCPVLWTPVRQLARQIEAR